MAGPSDIREGYLVIADIAGFTPYLAEAELDHASAVMRMVLDNLTESLVPPAHLAEIEGDAVFVYIGAEDITRGELIAELVESTYAAFRDLRAMMLRNATCPCRACRAIPGLDLKFVVHRGPYVLENLADRTKPVGSAVNLAHRLLKNHVTDETGWHAYVLYTEDALERVGLDQQGLHHGKETYEHLGTVSVLAEDLAERYEAALSGRRVLIDEEDAHAVVVHDFNARPVILWDWFNDPAKRNRWMDRAAWSVRSRPGGRLGAGAENHCSHFKVLERVVDYRPFDYYTFRYILRGMSIIATVALEPSAGGTRLAWRMQIEGRMPLWLKRPMARLLASQRMRLEKGLTHLEALLEEGANLDKEAA